MPSEATPAPAAPPAAARPPAPGEPPARREVLGCPFDLVTFDQAVERAIRWCAPGEPPRTIVTMNAALLVAMRETPDLAAACRAGDLVVPDGLPVVWASALVGAPLPERIPGVDLMPALMRRAGEVGLSAFLLGARPEVVAALAASCATRFPGLRLAGYRDGYFGEADHARVIAQIRDSGADLLFVGMPSPFKEVFAERYRAALGVRVILGVGGSFDVLAGFVRRAPPGMQRLGLEWLWRLLMEPRRLWRRYLVTNTQFILAVGREAARRLLPSARARS